jgi:hypothetical protein
MQFVVLSTVFNAKGAALMKVIKLITLLAIGFGAVACAQQQQQQEAPIVVPEPVYDKYGNPV